MSLLCCLTITQFFVLNNALIHSIFKSDRALDAGLTTPELIKKYGYPLEIHHVVTEDGYILELHRIPYGRNSLKRNSSLSSPILMQHGLGSSSVDWVLMGPERGLGYILADEGFDVWFGNGRGNIYSRNHTSISTKNVRFWDFSYHEGGLYDLPATIDYILEETGYDKLQYIGHSQGTAQFWVMMSEKPIYNSKISLMIALAPVAYTGHMRGFITVLSNASYLGVWIGESFGYPEFHTRSTWGKILSSIVCRDSVAKQYFCTNLMFVVTGFNQTQLSAVDTKVIADHIPAGGSWKQAIHFGQGYIHKDHFRQFDYKNDEKNYKLYNSLVPPEYELNKVTVPVAIFNSEADLLANTEDVELLMKKLNNIVYHKKLEGFSHFDFLWGKFSMTHLFKPILDLLTHYKLKDISNSVLL